MSGGLKFGDRSKEAPARMAGRGIETRMKEHPRAAAKHQLDHVVPTVIHHPEDDMPVFERWVHRAMKNQTRFWGLLIGVVVVVIGLTALVSGLSLGRATADQAWTELELAKTAAERVDVAKK